MRLDRPVVPDRYSRRRYWYWAVAAVVLMALAAIWVVKAQGGGEDDVPAPAFVCSTQAQMVVMGGGRVDCCFRAEAGQPVDLVGAMSIRIYGSDDGQRWSLERTYRYSELPFLMDTDTDAHQGQVSFYGTPGRYYKAWVITWAEGEAGGESRCIWTPAVQA